MLTKNTPFLEHVEQQKNHDEELQKQSRDAEDKVRSGGKEEVSHFADDVCELELDLRVTEIGLQVLRQLAQCPILALSVQDLPCGEDIFEEDIVCPRFL